MFTLILWPQSPIPSPCLVSLEPEIDMKTTPNAYTTLGLSSAKPRVGVYNSKEEDCEKSVLSIAVCKCRLFIHFTLLSPHFSRVPLFFALFLKERKSNSLFGPLFKRAKERFALLRSFQKEPKSDSLFGPLFKRAKEQFALWLSFCKERKSKSLFVALFVKNDLLFVALFKRAKERFALCCSF